MVNLQRLKRQKSTEHLAYIAFRLDRALREDATQKLELFAQENYVRTL